ncbi:MAG TPA: hypothetical protein VLC54_20470 [Anaeromyxobacter sp.]|nr:hypothetical protein [Anaeromyxobacter sp.]
MRHALPRRGPTARLALAALAIAVALRVDAATPEPLPTLLSARAGRMEASVDLSAAFPAGTERDFGNGLTNVVAIYVSVVPDGARSPVALYGRVVEILFDVWEETYAVTVKDPRAPQGVHQVLPDFAALRRFLSETRGVDLGPTRALPSSSYHLEARVEVNPVSREQLQRTREYIANPSAGTRTSGGTRSVLGAVASFLLREPDPGSDVHLFRSRSFAGSSSAGVPR